MEERMAVDKKSMFKNLVKSETIRIIIIMKKLNNFKKKKTFEE